MSFDPNDPKLTAFVLGELDATEQSAIESQLAQCAQTRQFVEELRHTAELLTSQLAAEPNPGLSDENRQAIEREISRGPRRRLIFRRAPLALAASLLVAVGAVAWLRLGGDAGSKKGTYTVALLSDGAPAEQSMQESRSHPEVSPPGWDKILGETGASGRGGVGTRGRASDEKPLYLGKEGRQRGDKNNLLPTGPEVAGRVSAGAAPAPGAKEVLGQSSASREEFVSSMRTHQAYPQPQPAKEALADRELARPLKPMPASRPESGTELAKLPESLERKPSSSSAPARRSGVAGVPPADASSPSSEMSLSAANTTPGEREKVSDMLASTDMKRSKAKEQFGLMLGPGGGAASVKQATGAARPAPAATPSAMLPQEPGSSTARRLASPQKPKSEAYATALPAQLAMDPRTSGLRRPLDPSQVKLGEGLAKGISREPPAAPEPERLAGKPTHVTEAYDHIAENPFLAVRTDPLSTFSIDVDTGSYANVRRFLNRNTLPPKDAVRIEELVNYFSYDYPPPTGKHPFSVNLEVAECPWNPEHRLVRVGLKGKQIAPESRPPSNLIFLLDVSGSMRPDNKLPLVKRGMQMLLDQLDERDRVAIVTYAGKSGMQLPSTSCDRKSDIQYAIEQLKAGGSTNAGGGIELAYRTAVENFLEGGTNRVILATDGDFNVGITNRGDLTRLIEEKAKTGVFLSVLGFGMGNLKDATLETLADKGNGNYAYIDTENEARKVLVEQLAGTLVTIAKDVKVQVELNPRRVAAYRLNGYENRMLRAQDFRDDKKDAGEIGAGHTVTALYTIVPVGKEVDIPNVGPLKYQRPAKPTKAAQSDELLTVRLRYKLPDADKGIELAQALTDTGKRYAQASDDFKFAAAVASFGLVLRDSQYKGNASYDSVLELAQESLGSDKNGYRSEFVELVREARAIAGGR